MKGFVVKKLLVVLSIITLMVLQVFAEVKLPAIISDNMVLQQNSDVRIWGWADSGEIISIKPSWISKTEHVTADEKGKWMVTIKTPKAGKNGSIKICGKNNIELKNIIIGEIWLCSGQSNMNMTMKGWYKQPIAGGPEDINNSSNDKIRLFIVEEATADEPVDDVKGQWFECSPETVKQFSAVGYYFGREINAKTRYPVGLIASSWGGTPAEAWTRLDYIKNDDSLKYFIDFYNAAFEKWQQDCDQANAIKKTVPKKPPILSLSRKPSMLYNGMIAPLTNMTIKGVIWYQGESNTSRAYLYRDLFPTMIKNWRCDFENYDMPFYFVQIANFTSHKPGQHIERYQGPPRDHEWAELRESQLMANEMKNTGMAVTIDIGETNNIHPANKKDVGKRLALWALAKNYNKDIEYSGPLYSGYTIESDKIRIYFNYAEGGLKFKDDIAKGFAIAGEDRKFVWADAEIQGNTVVVFSDKIPKPISARYAWDIDPEACLYNNANLPASPFRTDDWHGVTFNSK